MVDFTAAFHGLHHSDSVIPFLVSVVKWTPFYWAQDRYGMLLPLLAWPLRAPYANVLFQSFLMITAGLWCFFLLPRYLRVRGWLLTGLICGAVFLLQTPPIAFTMLHQPYGVAQSILLAGLLLIEPAANERGRAETALRSCGYALLAMAAHWVNPATALQFAPLILVREFLHGRRDRGWAWGLVRSAIVFGIALATIALSLHFSSKVDIQHTQNTILPMAQWFDGVTRLLADFLNGNPGSIVVRSAVVLPLVGLALGVALRASRPGFSGVLGWFGVLLSTVAACWVLAASNLHILQNGYGWRYVQTPVLLLLLGGAMVLSAAVAPWFERLPAKALGPAAALMMAIAGVVTFGAPTFSPMAEFAKKHGEAAQSIVDAGCPAVAGDYWQVWPIVLEALQRQRAAGKSGAIVALSVRTQGVADVVRAMDPTRICIGLPATHGRPPAIQYAPFPVLPATQQLPAMTIYGPLRR